MDAHHFKRNARAVKAACVQGQDGSIVTLKPATVYIPERFIEKQLAAIGKQTKTVGVFAHCVGNEYAVYVGAAMIQTEPTSIATVKFGADTYLQFSYDPGARVIVTQEVVQENLITYQLYEEIISKGHNPWYLGYDDKLKLFYSSNRLAGVDLMSNHAILELAAAATCRNPDDLSEYYRQMVQSYDDLEKHPPVNIPLTNVTHGATNTTSRLMGSQVNQGMTSALVYPSTDVENIERLLRT